MFGVEQRRMIDGLRAVQRRLCTYLGSTCDCKYGAGGQHEQTGCPEVRAALEILQAMTPAEYRRVCKRAKVHIFTPEMVVKAINKKKGSKVLAF